MCALLPDPSSPRRRRAAAPVRVRRALLAAATVILSSCSPAQEPHGRQDGLELIDLVPFQSHQVSTDLISLPEDVGLDRVVYGWWWQEDAASGDRHLQLAESIGVLELFSADADLRQVELEIAGAAAGEPPPHIQIRLNGKRVQTLPLPADWTSVLVDIPDGLVRQGTNLLQVVQRQRGRRSNRKQQSRLLLRRARISSANGRAAWPERPDAIRSQADSDTIELPVTGYLDAVFEVPAAATLEGLCDFESRPRKSSRPVFLYARVLDEEGDEWTPLHERFYKTTGRSRRLAIDLSAWSGRKIRLRLGATGSGNGIFRFHGLRVKAPQAVRLPTALPPIQRQTPPRSAALGRPDVVIILLDAARADAFSPWGGPVESPALEKLAEDGTVFSDAISPSSWTGQSVPAIFTGLLPDALRIGALGSRLPDEVPTLAELMGQSGYRTVLWSQHPLYRNHQSFRRGFEEFHRSPPGDYQVLPATEQLIDDSRPSFAFVHLIPPHAPYEPPPPFRGSRSSWYRGDLSVKAGHLNSYPRRRDPQSLSEEDLQYAVDRYLENAAFADHLVGRILRSLQAAGRYEESLVIVLSDHGEAFAEHGRFLHTRTIHREMLHIPFLIKWPRSAAMPASQVSQPVSLIDLAPTLADLLGLDGAEPGFHGRSLAAAIAAGSLPERVLYAVTRGDHSRHRPPSDEVMLQAGAWRLLWSVENDRRRLYRAETDPGERYDLSREMPLRALELRQAALAQRWANRHLLAATTTGEEFEEIDPETQAELEALGYVD